MWGAELSMVTIATELRKQGYPVEIWAASSELLAEWGASRRSRLLSPPQGRSRKNLALLPLLAGAPRGSTLVTWDVELLPALAALRPRFKARGISTALDLHLDLSGRLTPRLTRFLGRGLDACIAISRFVARQVAPVLPTTVVYRPVAVLGTEPLPQHAKGPLTVGVVGRIDPEKKLHLAVQAIAEMPAPARLVVRGAPFVSTATYLEDIRQAAALASIDVGFEGRVPQDRAMQGIDVLLHCNDKEAAGRVVQEAQLAGVVPVVPDAGGAREFISHNQTGLVYRSGDPRAAASAMTRLRDATLRETLAQQALLHARKHYSVSRQAFRYVSALPGSAWHPR